MSDDMSTFWEDSEDASLLAELRALAAEHDPLPPDAVAAARSAFAWRTMDAELAELMSDSSVDQQPATVRSAALPTLLSFEAAGFTVEIEVLEAGGRRRLLGQLVPPQAGVIEVRHGGAALTVPADEVGRFSASDVEAGPVSLRCQAGGRVVETDWFIA
jgi:hypothetical protein